MIFTKLVQLANARFPIDSTNGISTVFSLLQPEKASSPISEQDNRSPSPKCNLFRMTFCSFSAEHASSLTLSRFAHPLNASSPIQSIVEGISMPCSAVQSLKASSHIHNSLTDEDRLIYFRLAHLRKAPSPISSRVGGILMSFNLTQPLKASLPILTTEEAFSTVVSHSQPTNAHFSISVTDEGISTLCNFSQ